ncbi:MAG: Clp protease N-terminal domain-containing protein, partial [Desulfatiglandales bacterium]
MRFDKFTLKAQEVIQNSQEIASRKGHQQIEPEHLLYALLEQREGIIPSLLGKIGVKEDAILHELNKALDQLPSVSGAGYGGAYISPRSKGVFDQALKEAAQMKDEYVSVEHMLLAIL